jgi:xylan 1,4-beta-xylosidase
VFNKKERLSVGVLALTCFCLGAPQLTSGLQTGGLAAASPEGRDFKEGSVKTATVPWLSATQGVVDIACQMPEDWPSGDDAMLFHAQSKSHVHATLFFRNGALNAVYKGGEAFYSCASLPESAKWAAGSWHRIQFGWRLAQGEDGATVTNDVSFTLLADGKLAGEGYSRVMEPWPAVCELGGRNGTALWRGKVRHISLSAGPLQLSEYLPDLKVGERSITVKADRPVGSCYRFWTVANCNGPHRFLKPTYAAGINQGQPFISEINAVYLLGGRYKDQNVWYRGIRPDGELDVDFSGLIAQLQAMLDGGFTPWVVLDKTPHAMCRSPQENTYGNTEPPDDVRVWARYVEAALRAMVAAFGKEQVGQWWFRVGTEPDLYPGHWTGTREQYFELYDHTVAAVSNVVPGARIGPGNILNPRDGQFGTRTRGMWGLDIIDHAACGTNAVTGGTGARMDWFSCSWYARVGRPLSDFDEAVKLMRDRLARYPQFRDTPLIIGEFTVLHDEHGRRIWGGDTTEWAASFYAGMADRVYRTGIRRVYEWSQTTDGVLHPRTQVIAMLDRMAEGQRVETEVRADSAADCGAVACRKGDDLYVLLYNHRARRSPSVKEKVRLVVRDTRMKRGAVWQLSESLVDAEHAVWAYAFAADCRAAGVKPLPQAGRYEGGVSLLYGPPGVDIFRKNKEKYARLAQVTETAVPVSIVSGRYERDIEMAGHSVRLIKLSPPVSETGTKKRSSLWDSLRRLLH